MNTRYKVVMLPTNEATGIWYNQYNVYKVHYDNSTNLKNLWKKTNYVPQHLYIVEPEATINVNDVVLNLHNLQESGLSRAISPILADIYNNKIQVVKVIASTDTSLGLPNIPQHFIDAYIANPNVVVQNVSIILNDDKWESNVQWEKPQSEQVDWELLKEIIDSFEGYAQDAQNDYQAKGFRNMELFFSKLKESPDFAIQAHYALMTEDGV